MTKTESNQTGVHHTPSIAVSDGRDRPSVQSEKPEYRALTLDMSKYQQFIEDGDYTDTQKEQVLEALWTIIVGFVDLGFGIHPLQQIDQEFCGQDELISCASPEDLLPLLDSKLSKETHEGGRA